MKNPKAKKTTMVSFKTTDRMIERMNYQSNKTGIPKTVLIEQGLEKRLSELEKTEEI